MSVCWSIICDETQEQLWIGQGSYMYVGDRNTMKDLETFLYATRHMPLRVGTDLEECDYIDLSGVHNDKQWPVWESDKFLGVFKGSWREAVKAAVEQHYPSHTLCEPTLVTTCNGEQGKSGFSYKPPRRRDKPITLERLKTILTLAPGGDNV